MDIALDKQGAATELAKASHRADIDGLRAVAIIAVLLFHFNVGTSGGFIGVDVFFVISGFLITGILQRGDSSPGSWFVDFWIRRVLRILPALVTVVVATLAVGWALLLPQDYADLAASAIYQSLLVSNVYFWETTSYFASPAQSKPLLHTWSLSVEEQFYLIFPFVVWSLRRFSLTTKTYIYVVALGVSLAGSIYGGFNHPAASFFLLPTRAWELLTGSILACMGTIQLGRFWRELISITGIAMIIFAAFAFTEKTVFPGYLAAIPCLGTALVIGGNSAGKTIVGNLLSLKPVVFIGLISYSLYLWHWPTYVYWNYWKTTPLEWVDKAGLLTVSLIFASLSWYFIEQPFRKMRRKAEPKVVFATAACCLTAICLLGFGIRANDGVKSRVPEQALAFAAAKDDAPYYKNVSHKEIQNRALWEVSGDKASSIDLLVWGDSHAMMIEPALTEVAKDSDAHVVGAHYANTPPLTNFVPTNDFGLKEHAPSYNAEILALVKNQKIRQVLLVANWNGYRDSSAERDSAIVDALCSTVKLLKVEGCNVFVMHDVPVYDFDVPRALAGKAMFKGDSKELLRTVVEQKRIRTFEDQLCQAAEQNGAIILDPVPFLSNEENCELFREGRSLYTDSNHLSKWGASQLVPMFTSLFEDKHNE